MRLKARGSAVAVRNTVNSAARKGWDSEANKLASKQSRVQTRSGMNSAYGRSRNTRKWA
jgi:hypothetical protein